MDKTPIGEQTLPLDKKSRLWKFERSMSTHGSKERKISKDSSPASTASKGSRRSIPDSPRIIPTDVYGYLLAFGYNNAQPIQGTHPRYRIVYEIRKRREANGVKAVREIDLSSAAAKKAISDHHTVTYFSEKGFGSVVEYKKDNKSDLFQIGRSTENCVDFIVMDTIPGPKSDAKLTQSTISRFACRLVCERSSPYRTRIFAAAFDTNRRVFLNESAPQWSNAKKLPDGLTTNGVLVCTPKGPWGPGMKHGLWREVSVSGEIFGLRYSRSAKQRGKVTEDSNTLQDGSMIDLCGVVLVWRTPEGMSHAPTIEDLTLKRDMINALKAQCPVGFVTLRFPSGTQPIDSSNPHVYTACGHVHGYHTWGLRPSIARSVESKYNDKRQCPFCKEMGVFIPLKFSMEPAFYVDNGPATHAFVPCGHVTTEATVKYWSRVPLPHGKDQFRAACPFCALPLEGETGYVKLIFQTNAEPKKETLLL